MSKGDNQIAPGLLTQKLSRAEYVRRGRLVCVSMKPQTLKKRIIHGEISLLDSTAKTVEQLSSRPEM